MINKYMLYFSVIFAPLSGSAVITLLSTFSSTFNVTISTAGLALTAYIIPFAIFQLFSGAIADAFSKKMSLVISLGIFGVLGFVIAFAPTFEFVLVARFFMGIVGSFQIPVVVAIVGEMEIENKGREFGLLTIFINLGLALGPLVSGLISVFLSWQAFFLIVGFGSLLNSFILFKSLKIESDSKPSSTFITQSKLTLNNIITALRNSQVWIFSISGLFAFTGLVSAYVFLPIYLLDLNYRQDVAGFIISVAGITAMMFGPFAGKTIDKYGRKKPLVFGFLLSLIAYIGFRLDLLIVQVDQQIFFFVLMMAIIGAGNAFAFSAMNTIASEIIDDLKATVSSLSSSFRFIGFAFLPLLIPFYSELGFVFFINLGIVLLIIGLVLLFPLKTKRVQVKIS